MPQSMPDIENFIHANLRLTPVPLVPEVRLHLAHPGSGLSRLTPPPHGAGASPYWAYAWAGGTALARHVLDHPLIVAGRGVLDLGSGSGLVAIAACMAGAARVAAAEIDANAQAAIKLNAAANGVTIQIVQGNMLEGPAPTGFDLILAGDVFYDAAVAETMTRTLAECRQAGIDILIGDPGRPFLPDDRLTRLASYTTPDFGMAPGNDGAASHVFRFD